jgi:hypothetical protein
MKKSQSVFAFAYHSPYAIEIGKESHLGVTLNFNSKKIFFILELRFCWSWVPWPFWSPLPLPTTPICLWPTAGLPLRRIRRR